MKTMLENRYTPTGYLNAINLMNSLELESDEWKAARENVFEIVENGIRQENKELAAWFACTVLDDLDTLLGMSDGETDAETEEAIAYNKALLIENGFGHLLDDLFD